MYFFISSTNIPHLLVLLLIVPIKTHTTRFPLGVSSPYIYLLHIDFYLFKLTIIIKRKTKQFKLLFPFGILTLIRSLCAPISRKQIHFDFRAALKSMQHKFSFNDVT